MTPEEINRMIAEWVGLDYSYYFAHPEELPDYYRSNAAMDLLGVLVERGYKVDVQSDAPRWSMVLQYPGMKRAICSLQSTIPAAICTAIMELKERESNGHINKSDRRTTG